MHEYFLIGLIESVNSSSLLVVVFAVFSLVLSNKSFNILNLNALETCVRLCIVLKTKNGS